MSEPPAEITLTAEDVDRLIATQHPHLRAPLRRVAHGWDNDVYRLGDELAVRLPRRELAAALIEKEQRWLPLLAERIPVPIPVPIAAGRPGEGYPWHWSILPWFRGQRANDLNATRRDAVAEQLAEALLALHAPSPPDAPINPVRGVPMADRDDVARKRLANHPRLLLEWSNAVDAPAWSAPPVWVHGDVHPGNIVLEGDRIVALIDFGDLGSGDPACDLAAAWLMFTPVGRARFRQHVGERYDEATWLRARGWAAAMAGLLLGADDASFHRMAEHTIRELAQSSE
ncbi:MAG: aminoglycoside phosphotransferase family protein [Cryobacterium sp.]|nr:aminoglycoside phosphotransferase family protein [Cryobacterium sp.]